MSIRDSLKEALKDPAVVQVLTNAITSSLRGEIRTLREALERKEEKDRGTAGPRRLAWAVLSSEQRSD